MIERLACKLGRNDEAPNIELAVELSRNNDRTGIKEIVDGFVGADKVIANNCIKVLYEVADKKPELIADYANEFIKCLNSKE